MHVQMVIKYKDGDERYTDYTVLEADYLSGKLHPSDLKPACTAALNQVYTAHTILTFNL
jgi:hypothetical protein